MSLVVDFKHHLFAALALKRHWACLRTTVFFFFFFGWGGDQLVFLDWWAGCRFNYPWEGFKPPIAKASGWLQREATSKPPPILLSGLMGAPYGPLHGLRRFDSTMGLAEQQWGGAGPFGLPFKQSQNMAHTEASQEAWV